MSVKRTSIFLALIGPAGAGKSVLGKEVLKANPSFKLSVSATTREMRKGEVDGVDYHFLKRPDFEQKVKENKFFEWEEVHGNLYGTLLQEIDGAMSAGTDLLFDIDIRGARSLRQRYPEHLVCIAVLPPSKEILKERIKGRGTISDDELSRRMKTAESEYATIQSAQGKEIVDYVVINEDWNTAKASVLGIVESEMLRYRRYTHDSLKEILSK